MRTDALDFDLPDRLIATAPAEPRDSARLMVCRRGHDAVSHHHVRDLPGLADDLGILRRGDALVVNRSRVLPAYLEGMRSRTGGRITGLYLDGHASADDASCAWSVMLEARGKLEPGETVALGDALMLKLMENESRGAWRVQPCDPHGEPLTLDAAMGMLQTVGRPPLPPYIRKARKALGLPELNADDPTRYNTVYADAPGSVAAPTAGLHFTPGLLERVAQRGVRQLAVTLHVGVGTFLPVRSDTLEGHVMHAERYHVDGETLAALRDVKQQGGRCLVVGTTAVRTLESLPPPEALAAHVEQGVAGDTDLFIRPDAGFVFRYTDALLTNFHLPRSTLLALVAALPGVGLERLLGWYRHAIEAGYRFYSYGDAMLVV